MFSNSHRITNSRQILILSQIEELILEKKLNLSLNYYDIELIHHKKNKISTWCATI